MYTDMTGRSSDQEIFIKGVRSGGGGGGVRR